MTCSRALPAHPPSLLAMLARIPCTPPPLSRPCSGTLLPPLPFSSTSLHVLDLARMPSLHCPLLPPPSSMRHEAQQGQGGHLGGLLHCELALLDLRNKCSSPFRSSRPVQHRAGQSQVAFHEKCQVSQALAQSGAHNKLRRGAWVTSASLRTIVHSDAPLCIRVHPSAPLRIPVPHCAPIVHPCPSLCIHVHPCASLCTIVHSCALLCTLRCKHAAVTLRARDTHRAAAHPHP